MKYISPGMISMIATIVFLIILRCLKIKYLDFINIVTRFFMDFKSRKAKIVAFFLYIIILPIIISFGITRVDKLNNDSLNVITLIVSILMGMLFSLISIIIDVNDRIDGDSDLDSTKYANMKKSNFKMFHAIMFEILVSILLLIVCFASVLSGVENISKIDSYIIYYFLFTLIVNLFMILKASSELVENILSKRKKKEDFNKELIETLNKIKKTVEENRKE